LFDSRNAEGRSRMMEYWLELMMSGAPELLSASRVSASEVDMLKQEWRKALGHPDTIFYYHFMQGTAAAFADKIH
ncbi:MAG TPA: hypothetical protein VK633_11150, partial [Verrucomicrobiae bacterium]|nr:hypothetical protein [Verrucomicrobiae bacterium]